MAAKDDKNPKAKGDEDLEEDEDDVEKAEDEETPPEDNESDDDGEEEEDDLPDDPAELKKLVRTTRASLQKVTKESVKRKKKIRALISEHGEPPAPETGKSKDESKGDEALRNELAAEKKKNVENERRLRSARVSELVDDVLSNSKFSLANSTARKDLVRFVAEELGDEDLEDDDEAAELVAEAVKGQLKLRPHLKGMKKRAPETDATERSKGSIGISEKLIEDVAGTMGLDAS